jgi:hypothetical protein
MLINETNHLQNPKLEKTEENFSLNIFFILVNILHWQIKEISCKF